jgi:TRAP-type transport system periplasmic protein
MKYLRLAVLLIGAATMVDSASAQSYPEIKIRQNNLIPAAAGLSQTVKWYAGEIKKRSGDKITIENFWSGAAGAPSEMLKLVGGGALDAGTFSASYFPAQLPFLASMSALPLSLPNAKKAQVIANALWTKVPAFQEEAKANKIWPVFFQVLNQYHLLCTSPVKTLADLKNKKIRSQGEYIPLALRAIGAVPVTVLPGEFYEAMQRGTIDCMLLPWDLMNTFKLYEVAKYGSSLSFGALVANGEFYNLAKWNSFPGNVKQLFQKTAADAQVFDLNQLASLEKNALDNMKKNGVKIVPFEEEAAFKAKMPNFLDLWLERMKKLGKGEAAAKAVEIWRSAL